MAGDSAGSISFWVKDLKSHHFLFNVSKAGEQNAGIIAGPYYVGVLIDNGDPILYRFAENPSGMLGNGQWHHVVVEQDGTALKIYVDGTLQTLTGSINKVPGAWFDDLKGTMGRASVGCRLSANGWFDHYFDGKVDDLRYYRKALNANEINALYNNGAGTEEKNPVVP